VLATRPALSGAAPCPNFPRPCFGSVFTNRHIFFRSSVETSPYNFRAPFVEWASSTTRRARLINHGVIAHSLIPLNRLSFSMLTQRPRPLEDVQFPSLRGTISIAPLRARRQSSSNDFSGASALENVYPGMIKGNSGISGRGVGYTGRGELHISLARAFLPPPGKHKCLLPSAPQGTLTKTVHAMMRTPLCCCELCFCCFVWLCGGFAVLGPNVGGRCSRHPLL